MPKPQDDAHYVREHGPVFDAVFGRLLQRVLGRKPRGAGEIVAELVEVLQSDLGKSDSWRCDLCAHPNSADADNCAVCRTRRGEVRSPTESDLRGSMDSIQLRQLSPTRTSDPKRKAAPAVTVTSKFGDGADRSSAQEKVPDKPHLLPKKYRPPSELMAPNGSGILSNLASWFSPQGHRLWGSETIQDFVKDASFMVKFDQEVRGSAPSVDQAMKIRVLYAYTHSQLAPRKMWALWCPPMDGEPGKWEPLTDHSHLEDAYQAKAEAVELLATPEVCRALRITAEPGPLVTFSLSFEHMSGITAYTNGGSGMALIRYINNFRGDRVLSPLRDTVAWLPCGSTLADHPLDDCHPYSGVLEFIAANDALLSFDDGSGGKTWSCRPLEYPECWQLRNDCIETPNQQKEDKFLDRRLRQIIHQDSVPEQGGGFPSIPASLFRDVVLASIPPSSTPNPMFTPEQIARALTMQCLVWRKQHFLLTLSTTTVETRTPHILANVDTGEITRLYRTVASFWPEQIFYLLNMAMRETQFGNLEAQLVVPDTLESLQNGTAGKYFARPPADTKRAAASFSKKDRGMFGTLHRSCCRWDDVESSWVVTLPTGSRVQASDVSVALKGWMLPQVQPLIYFTNKALDAIEPVGGVIKTYRGIRCALPRNQYAVGRVLVWAQYTSTSEDQGVAAAFAAGDSPAAVFTIHGTTCNRIQQYSRFAREAEMLYNTNSCFEVTESLTQEQAQILGKENLQLFTLNEVDEVQMQCILVRQLLPRAKTTAAASVVFRAVEALKSDCCLELSLSSVKAGEVPPKWQILFSNASYSCPIPTTTVWRDLSESAQAVAEHLYSVSRTLGSTELSRVPNSYLYNSEAPAGYQGTAGMVTLLVGSDNEALDGEYRKVDINSFRHQDDNAVIFFEDMWKVEVNGGTIGSSVELLGQWFDQKAKEPLMYVKPGIQHPLTDMWQLRCPEGHYLRHKKKAPLVEGPRKCSECPVTDITGNSRGFYACDMCEYFIGQMCRDVVSFQSSGDWVRFAIEENSLVKYQNDHLQCPEITRLTYIKKGDVVELHDQLGSVTVLPNVRNRDVIAHRIARLASLIFVNHNIPLWKEHVQPTSASKEVLDEITSVIGLPADQAPRMVRVFGRVGKEGGRRELKMKIGKQEEDWWCVDMLLRQTDRREGLAAGAEGADMVCRLIKMGVRLRVISLRNNAISPEWARTLLESLRTNPSVIELTLGDDDGEHDQEEVGVMASAIGLRCLYHRFNRLNEDHLAGLGERWPEIVAFALYDIDSLKLPLSTILHQHPQGWGTLCNEFQLLGSRPPRVTQDALHRACRGGRVRAVVPLLDECRMKETTPDTKGTLALFYAVRQLEFERSDDGPEAIRRLATPEVIRKRDKLTGASALKCAVGTLGPVVANVLLECGLCPTGKVDASDADVIPPLFEALQNRRFNTDMGRKVLGKLIVDGYLERIPGCPLPPLIIAAKTNGLFHIVDELLNQGADPDVRWNHRGESGCVLHCLVACTSETFTDPIVEALFQRIVESAPETLEAHDEGGRTPLLRAAENAITPVKLLIACGANKEAVDHDSCNAFWRACDCEAFNSPEGCEVLSDLLVGTVDVRDVNQRTPLHVASRKGLVHIVRYLVEAGADKEALDADMISPLHYACSSDIDYGDKPESGEVLKALIGEDINRKCGELKNTALNCAASAGNPGTVRVLLEMGADITIGGTDGCLPIHNAMLTAIFDNDKRLDVVRCLISPEVINHADIDGWTPLHYSANSGRIRITRLLLENGADTGIVAGKDNTTILYRATFTQAFGTAEGRSMVRELATDATLNMKCDVDEDTPLLMAATHGVLGMVEELLNLGADVACINSCGSTALHEASKDGNFGSAEGIDVYKRLITEDILHLEDEDGWTPLTACSRLGCSNMMKVLLDYGADPKKVHEEHGTALLLACASEQFDVNPLSLEVLERLVGDGEITNATDSTGSTALIAAARRGRIKLVERLLKYSADPNHVDNHGRTALHELITHEVAATKKGLIVLGKLITPQNVSLPDSEGSTPAHLAARSGQAGALELLLKEGGLVSSKSQLLHIALEREMLSKTGKGQRILRMLAEEEHSSPNELGLLPIEHAAKHSTTVALSILLEAGADVNAVLDDNGNTILHKMAMSPTIQRGCFDFLLTNESIVLGVQNAAGQTPFDLLLETASSLEVPSTVHLKLARAMLDKMPQNQQNFDRLAVAISQGYHVESTAANSDLGDLDPDENEDVDEGG